MKVSKIHGSPVRQGNSIQKGVNKNNKKPSNIIKKDEYVLGKKENKSTIYTKVLSKTDEKTIQRLKEESDRAYSHLKRLVEDLLSRQGMTFRDAVQPEDIKVDKEGRLEASKMLEEGGQYSIEAVSDRIVDFAIAISGGDRSKLDMLKSAIDEGFREAERLLGGQLPEISYKTYDVIMEKLDKWANE